MPELKHVLAAAVTALAEAGVPSPSADANILVAHGLGVERRDLARRVILGYQLSSDENARVAGLLEQRAKRVPLQHLTGSAGFRRLELLVGPGVFVPRVETEWVAGLAIEAGVALEHPLIVDLCTGSGAIALAVADEVPDARVVAVELDPPAVEWARRNIEALGSRVELRAGDAVRAHEHLLADLAGAVDIVVANPPYIPPDAEPTEPEVRDHDPVLALYGGGDDGLAIPRGVVAAAAGLLRPGGLLVMEHADVQGAGGRALTATPEWIDVNTQRDLTGRDRALVARRAG
ncbi:peptide chain release factor N(5)-glutamine methyltransferase [Kineosporia rhizophila]|uniref:peptide chain release factor N(5)-glutamine methyltransferase n=1 Tax=Kineosporia TaxID=49184 RepID=UPI001E5F3FC9|nr:MULTISPECIES: peptide chain release factor N(5)-glutamine methyltransferase [Kineosporia]MCE0539004.1 peptide chain release factor N(5)-glutamine methyltransferase [Kineosporia rhizophila]GLY17894.1 release factor glutamine methyltransferase [Kineosporia sp. NBRC 101677]